MQITYLNPSFDLGIDDDLTIVMNKGQKNKIFYELVVSFVLL